MWRTVLWPSLAYKPDYTSRAKRWASNRRSMSPNGLVHCLTVKTKSTKTLFTGQKRHHYWSITVRKVSYFPNEPGSSELRADFATSTSNEPSCAFDNVVSRFRERKKGSNVILCGKNCYFDSQSRNSIKSPFDCDVVVGFDTMVSFVSLGTNTGTCTWQYVFTTWYWYRPNLPSYPNDGDTVQSSIQSES